MFDEKEKIKYISETFRNIGIALGAGGMLAFSTTVYSIEAILTVLVGFALISVGYKILGV